MNSLLCAILAVLSIWDYPSRQVRHERLRRQMVAAVREGDTETMTETCRKGVKLLPDDPTWRFNLACALAYRKNQSESLDELEKAIDLGFRDVDKITGDADLKRLSKQPRFWELVEYAREISTKPILTGPMASVDATGIFGRSIAIGAQNLAWDFDAGCFVARMRMASDSATGNVGDLYMNRDNFHSPNGRQALDAFLAEFPGLTCVTLDQEGRDRKMDLDFPNIVFPYPAFGNCSRAHVSGPFWRSHPRALVTTEASRLKTMAKLYLSNQVWVFPANNDIAPVGKMGDLFASVTPYWLTTAGRSWSDLYYLRAALEASRSMAPAAKRAAVSSGLLAPTIQALIRKSLKGVDGEEGYLGAAAHPTALPPNGLDMARLKSSAAAMAPEQIPPLAVLSVKEGPVDEKPAWPECTYATGFAWAYVLRAGQAVREFRIAASGAQDYAFSVVHDDLGAAKLERLGASEAKIVLDRRRMTVTNRVDLAVFGKRDGTSWGAPSYVSFAVVDPSAPYSDPALTPLKDPPKDEPRKDIPAVKRQTSTPCPEGGFDTASACIGPMSPEMYGRLVSDARRD